jgi:hypothetical protein
MICWILAAYSKAEQLNDINLIPGTIPENEAIWQWGLRMVTSMIYVMLTDLLAFIWNLLTKWHSLSGERRFGSMLLLLLLITNIHYGLKERERRNRLSVYCPRDDCGRVAFPISGSHNRYRCSRKHQFAGEPHMF